MYTFEDRSGRSLTLRPEGTASVVRAALQHTLVPQGSISKLYYAGPMFRYERPQKGRMRQFWQIGVEALGADAPSVDAEVIVLLWRYFEAIGMPPERMTLLLNSMGDEECRPAYRDLVADHIRSHSDELCEECVRRADTNPLRAFDCKNEACVPVMARAPLLKDHLCDACSRHYDEVKKALAALDIPFAEDAGLVRGLDYYTRTVFEIQAEGLGAQNAIGGGGRYDRLMEEYGGKPTPGLGFALGFERTLIALEDAGVDVPAPARADVYVARVDDSMTAVVTEAAQLLRDAGLPVEMDHLGRSLKAQFKHADRLHARLVVIMGPDEFEAGEVTVRDMGTKEERRIPVEEMPERLSETLGRLSAEN
jgi:histidyl-tRNA synthetase